MMSIRFPVKSLIFVALFLLVWSEAELSSEQIVAFMNGHNGLRAKYNLKGLTWDSKAASVAQSYAQNCVFEHNDNRGSYGENIYATTSGSDLSANDATNSLNSWNSEEKNWDCASNTCPSGVCGHFTQVVWNSTVSVGCGMAKCPAKAGFLGGNPWKFVVCDYAPPGNFNGRRPFNTEVCANSANGNYATSNYIYTVTVANPAKNSGFSVAFSLGLLSSLIFIAF